MDTVPMTLPEHGKAADPPVMPVALSPDSLDAVLPMHLVVDADGRILSAGRTIRKAIGVDNPLSNLLETFAISKPRGITCMEGIYKHLGRKLSFSIRDGIDLSLRGVALPLEGDDGHLLICMTFGAGIVRASEQLGIKEQDFSFADATTDVLYMVRFQELLIADAKRLVEALETSKAEAERRATTDVLTGLPNRRALSAHLTDAFKADEPPEMTVFHADLDYFKKVNDTLGHAAGDFILTHAATILKEEAGPDAIVSRIGGDEFMLVVSCEDRADLRKMADRIMDRITQPIHYLGHACRIGISLGGFRLSDDPKAMGDPERAMTNADLALYSAKNAGRGRYELFEMALRARSDAENALASEIETALKARQFVPYFQPQVDTLTGRLIGLEVLVRWQHPTQGILAPREFLGVAEKTHLLEKIDSDVTAQALGALAEWRRAGLDIPKISINATGARLASDNLVEHLKWQLDQHDLSPSDLSIEILETIFLEREESATTANIGRLTDAGFDIQLDDFGTGHAAISTLLDIKINTVKIDRSFVRDIDRSSKNRLVTRAIIDLATKLGMRTLAEGVETRAEWQVLTELGCDSLQGYLFAHPLPQDSVANWIALRAPTAETGAANSRSA